MANAIHFLSPASRRKRTPPNSPPSPPKHSLATAALQTFVVGILQRMIFDGEQLSDLMAPLDLGWKARTQAELALMADLHPLLTKRAQGSDISGLSAYEQ
jgi:type I restriction enzyme R subunit